MMEKKRFEEIDIAKGIGILLVIIGHCFPDVSTSEGISVSAFRILHDVIYTFHMPCMFFLSGFLSKRIFRLHTIDDRKTYVLDRFVRLMVPYFVIGIVYMPVKMLLSRFANQPYDMRNFWQILCGENPNGGLWYLYALFVIELLLGIFISGKNVKYVLICSTITSILIRITGADFYRVDNAVYFMFFVVLGAVVGAEYEKFKEWFNIYLTLTATVLLALFDYIYFQTQISFIPFASGIAGSILVLCISRCLIQNGGGTALCRALKNLGRYSMDIYVMHGIVMVAIRIVCWSLLKLNYYVCTLLMLIGGTLIPVIVSQLILRKSKILTLLFVGERSKAL